MKTFDGLIPPEQRAAFNEQFIGGAAPFFSYATEKCAIDGMLAAAHFFISGFGLRCPLLSKFYLIYGGLP